MEMNIIGSKKEGNKRIYLKYCIVCSELYTSERITTECCGAYCRRKLQKIKEKNESAVFIRSNFILPPMEDIEDLGFTHDEISIDIRSKISK